MSKDQAVAAQINLSKILSVVSTMDDEMQKAVADVATRLIRIASQSEFGPIALSLASAQLAVDLTQPRSVQ